MIDDLRDDNIFNVKTHYAPNIVHRKWDNKLSPILTINPGDIVNYDFPDVSNNQIPHDATIDTYNSMNRDLMRPMVGPIYIEGAEPGDVLEVEVLDLKTRGWGWTVAFAGKGLLGDMFDEHYLRVFNLSNGDYVPFSDNIRVPIEPFLGTMGVAPLEAGEFQPMPPMYHGGNMDLRSLTKGAKLLLPVQVKGALFSAADGHAAQGDGEVSLTAVEAPLYGALRFRVIKDKKITTPQFIAPPSKTNALFEDKGYYGTTGIGPDLLGCARDAIKNMIEYLEVEHGLTWLDAYILCSISVSLRISEIVDMPNYLVSAYIPLSIFKY